MYKIGSMPHSIPIGYTGETNFRVIEIDMTAWMEKMPAGVPSIVHIRPGETKAQAYIAATTFDSETNILTWEITAGDIGTKEGNGLMQVWLEESENDTVSKRGKSVKVTTEVMDSVNEPDDDPPEAQAAYLEQMTELKVATVEAAEDAEDAAEQAQQAATDAENVNLHPAYIDSTTKHWMVYDATEHQYTDTEILAEGQDGQDGQDATPDLVTNDYSDLTFPVTKDTLCYHSGLLYYAKQDISTSEEWTAAHWQQTTLEELLSLQKNAIQGVSDFVGDTDTDIGTHVETEEKLSFANSTVISRDVTIKKTSGNLLEVSGTASATFLETIQNNIALPAGSYTFTIDNPIQSAGYQIQLHNIDADTVLQSFTSNATNQFYNFTLNAATNVRIRILITSGSVVGDSQKVSLYSRTTIDNTLSFATAKLMEDISFLTDRVKQGCGIIEDAGNVLTADRLTITGTNIKVRNDESKVFSPTAKRVTALADSATVKFAFGGVTYPFDTITVVFYFPYDSYKGDSPTSVELRVYANGSANTPIVSTANCCWGWNYLKIPKSKTGLGQSAVLSSVDFVFKKTSGTTETEFGEVIVDSIIIDMKMKPTFILDFDQIWEKSIDNGAYEYCRTKNIPYTVHTYQFDNLNAAKLAEMRKATLNGCEFSYYGGYTNENYMQNVTSYSDAVAECLLMENDIIPFTSKRFLTYGCGAHVMNKFLRESLEASGVKAIRGRWIQNPVGYFSDKSTWLPYSIEISYGNSTLEQIKAQIDEAIANGSCVVAFTHGVCDDDESVLGVSSSAIRLTTFKDMIDYLADLRNHGQIQICTMEQFVNQCIG